MTPDPENSRLKPDEDDLEDGLSLEDEFGEFEEYPEEDEEDEDGAEDALPSRTDLPSDEKVRVMAMAADAVKARDIAVLDLRGLTIIADFFLICTGNSSIQLRAIADRIEDRLREQGLKKTRIEGYQEATWILMDYGDVVAHVMAAEQREFYRLEEFWKDAPRVDLGLEQEPAAEPTF